MLIYVLIHLILLSLWKIVAMYEKRTRIHGEKIPFYYSGSLGDLFGFTFVVIAFTLIFSFNFILIITLSSITALLLTILLNLYWCNDSKRRVEIVSLYTQEGKTTLSGKLHLLYVFYIVFIELFFMSHTIFINIDFLALMYFIFGNTLYFAMVIVDRLRGII